MSDGNLKSQRPSSGVLQSSSTWFIACDNDSIINNPVNGSHHFTICHGTEDHDESHSKRTIVYDKVNDYFKIHPLPINKNAIETNICSNSSCLFLPVEAELVNVDDYHDLHVHFVIKPTDMEIKKTMAVDTIFDHKSYGRVHMVEQPKKWDVYNKHGNYLFKIHYEYEYLLIGPK